MIRVVVVDDHPIFLRGVVDTLRFEEDIFIVGQAQNGEEALSVIERKLPDVAVLDVNLPGINGLLLTRTIVEKKWPTRIVLLTAYDDVEQEFHALWSGANAYRSKYVQPEILIDTVRKVSEGKYFLDGKIIDNDELYQWLQIQIESNTRLNGDIVEPSRPLSIREMEVLSHLTRGKSNKDIANLLKISDQTVKNHITNIFRKLNVKDRTQAAVYALRQGWFRLYDQEPTEN
jgi:DNA-binding NarL/FixJ family response regulator